MIITFNFKLFGIDSDKNIASIWVEKSTNPLRNFFKIVRLFFIYEDNILAAKLSKA